MKNTQVALMTMMLVNAQNCASHLPGTQAQEVRVEPPRNPNRSFKYWLIGENMKSIFHGIAFLVLFTNASELFANALPDLSGIAAEVPTQELDARVFEIIRNEIPGARAIKKSHYTVALFEYLKNESHWYIVDGYYELEDGALLFLDFKYNPSTKDWREIENYGSFIPQMQLRYMLQAEEICNPYKRHYIGILQGYTQTGVDQLMSAFQEKFGQRPNINLDSNSNLFVYDNVDIGMDKKPFFALKESYILSSLGESAVANELHIIQSGRAESDDIIRKTYLPVGDSCAGTLIFRSNLHISSNRQ